MSDAYGKGVVRGQAENTNLRAYAKENDVTAAESVRTAQTESFFGLDDVNIVERLNDQKGSEKRVRIAEVDARDCRRNKNNFSRWCCALRSTSKAREVS